jgi:hypothetical protein
MAGRKPQCAASCKPWSGELPYMAMPVRTQSADTASRVPCRKTAALLARLRSPGKSLLCCSNTFNCASTP